MSKNINKATVQDLKTLGFNDEWAKWIINYRELLKQDPAHQQGFTNEIDLRQMNLPPEYLNMLVGKVTFDDITKPTTSLSSNLNRFLGNMGNTDTSTSSSSSPDNLQPQGDATLLASNDLNINPGREGLNTGSVKISYWHGWNQATIDQSQIQCSWPAEHAANRIKFVNDVFAFWFEARNSLSSEQANIDEILDKAGTEGWNDLKDLFKHLEDNSGYWHKYSDLATYWGGGEHSLFYPNQLDVPAVLVNFTNVIEKNLDPLRACCHQFYSDSGELEAAWKAAD